MRAKHVATALVVIAAGVSATAALRRFAGRRRAAMIRPAEPVAVPTPQPRPAAEQQAIVLPFTPRPAAPAPGQPATPARCGDTGGRTKAGAPCGARATSGGRCHHHKLAG
jgi:hypothetical protein